MFDKSLIPQQNAQAKQVLTSLYGSSGASGEQKSIIDKKLDKIDNQMKDKIANTITISEYFNQLWTQPELREEDKEFAIRKLEAIQQNKKLQIQHGDQAVSKSCGNLDAINAAFKMTAFEEYNLQEKIEEFKKKNKLDIKVTLNISTHPDPEVLHALNKVSKSAKAGGLHYTAGLMNEEEEDHVKAAKAEEFVRKIQAEKKNFKQSMKERELSEQKRELEDVERIKRNQKEEEERRNKEKKEKLEAHIKELKQRNENRQKESDKWEEEYRIYTAKKPLYKEYEDKYKKSVLMPELAERKKKLKEIRDFHKPIVREELDEHERKMAKALEEFNAKKEQTLSKEMSDRNKPYKKPDFESKYHQKIVEEASKQRNIKDHEKSEKLQKKERIMEYLQQVKEKHQPTADPAKELELLNMIEKLGKKKDNRSKTADDEERHESHMELRKKGNDYLLAVKEQVQEQIKRKKEKLHTTKDGLEEQSQVTDKNILHSVKSDTTFRKRNYLAELRKDNKLIAANQSSHVDSIIKNKKLDNSERKELLQTEVEKLEEKAKRLELLKKHKANKKQSDDDDNEVDQIYINAIRAKLEMLGN